MNNQPQPSTPLTYEALMASIHESNRFLTEQLAETRRDFKETDRILKEQSAETDRILKEQSAETDRILKEQSAETDRILKEQSAETDRRRKENERIYKESWEKYEKRMKNMEEQMGSWRNNHGSFAEEYFFNSFENGQQNFFGEQFDTLRRGLKSKSFEIEDEYDIVLYNHTSVAIIEVKFKAREKDLAQTLKKAATFRFFYPEYKDYKIYLGIASMCFNPILEQKYIEQGIAIIKQVGDFVVIHDEHLKVFW